MDYLDFGGGETGTVFRVFPDGSVNACTSTMGGGIERVSAEKCARAVLLCRNNVRVAPC